MRRPHGRNLGEGPDAASPWDGDDAVTDEFGTDHDLKYANFTEFDEPGEYRVVVGDEESYSFEIDDASELYAPVLRDVGRLYTLKRSSTRIEDPYTGLEMGPGHEQDEEAIIAEPLGDWLEDYEPATRSALPTAGTMRATTASTSTRRGLPLRNSCLPTSATPSRSTPASSTSTISLMIRNSATCRTYSSSARRACAF